MSQELFRRDFLLLAAPFLASTLLVECQVNFAQPLRLTVEKDGSATIEYGESTSWYLTIHLPRVRNPEKGDFRIEIPEETWGRCTPIKIFIPPTISDGLGFLVEIGQDRNTFIMVLITRKNNIPTGMDEWEAVFGQGGDDQAQIFEGSWANWKIARIVRNGVPLDRQRWPDVPKKSEALHDESCKDQRLTA